MMARKAQPLKPGQVIFFRSNAEEAAPGWYVVKDFDHDQSREFPKDGWWWNCVRLADGLAQTISERSKYLETNIEGAPESPL